MSIPVDYMPEAYYGTNLSIYDNQLFYSKTNQQAAAIIFTMWNLFFSGRDEKQQSGGI